MNLRRSVVVPVLGAVLLLLVAFLTTGGDLSTPPTQLPTSWVDVVLILGGGIAVGLLIVRGSDGAGRLTLLLFAAVALLSALSMLWSVAPDQTWQESGRTVAYVAVFAIGLAGARLGTIRSAEVVAAVTLAGISLCIWALAVKVFTLGGASGSAAAITRSPGLYGQGCYGRLVGVFGYWNATGLGGAMALPGLVYVSARAGGSRLLRGLAVAGIMLAVSVVALSYSRSAVAAALIATVAPFFFIQARRRAVLMAALGLVAAAPVCIYALSDHNVSGDAACSIYGASVTGAIDRSGGGLVLGLVILLVGAIITAVGVAVSGRLDSHPQPARWLRIYDRLLLGGVAAVPVLIIIFLLVNSRGPFGEISHLWAKLTAVNASVGGTASRLGTVANSRAAYWRQALSVGEHHLLAGTGVGTFFPAHLRYATALLTPHGLDVKHAHSYVLDTFASLGLIGVVLMLALFLAWWRDAIRAVARRGMTVVAERDARWALIGVVIAYGVSSALDWTWYYPGVTVPALLAAGWMAGVSQRRLATTTTTTDPTPTEATAAAAAPRTRRPLSTRPGAIIALTLLLTLTLAIAWESLQPMRSVQSVLASRAALIDNDGPAALSDAQAATREDPLSIDAMAALATVYGHYGEHAREQTELTKAVRAQPNNPQPFLDLGRYLFCRREFGASRVYLQTATLLDVTNSASQNALYDAAGQAKTSGLCRS